MADQEQDQAPEQEVKKKKQPLLTRRDALKIAGATAAAAVVTRVFMVGPLSAEAVQGLNRETEASEAYKWGMGINLDKCIGCQYCIWTCQATNNVPEDEMR
ncbi:MAG TPA: twin-arginine translocation signal domain-containing protein, partial [Chloroflexi bacterium]|nr:twin-arginine translocation signal domain-containing protein [Chloroflexota bacterium]